MLNNMKMIVSDLVVWALTPLPIRMDKQKQKKLKPLKKNINKQYFIICANKRYFY